FILAIIIWSLNTFPNYTEENETLRLQSSYATQIGHFIEPVVKPMGLDWKAGVGILTSFAAREVFVSSMAMIYNVADDNEDSLQESLLNNMREAKNSDGDDVFTTASTIGLLIFYVIALQCMATVGIIKKESGSWKFALTQLIAFNGIAYLLAVGSVWGLRAIGIN
ncbi:MAG: ferrous iron transporter B, partial [Bdellovibrionales bacterium]|nr:ferrous iron transporter B [Bdellovibrionales bacterium]